MTAREPTEAGFYDADVRAGGLATLTLEFSPWLPLYEAAAARLHPADPVVDLGCGTGRFAEALRRRELRTYTGVDFSEAAIAEARRYVKADYTFLVGDLREAGQFAVPIAGNTVFVSLEVLEHLEDDLAAVALVPPGHRFVFSVPNYPSAAHQRCFRHLADVFARFEPLLDFRAWAAIDLSPPAGRRVHLLDTVRRADSWR